MTFASPEFLPALLAIPLVAAAYAAARRRRRRFAVRFPATATLAGVSGPRWRRWLPGALMAAAAATVGVAFARPQATVAQTVQKASVILVTDESGSMSANDVEPSRLEAARAAAEDFLDRAPKSLLVGFVGYSSHINAVVEPTQDRDAVRSSLESAQADGGTATGDALNAALDRLATRHAPAAVILLSDGQTTEGGDPLAAARRAKQLRIPVSTVALGTSDGTVLGPNGEPIQVPPDPATLQQISKMTGGTFTETADAGQLSSVYKKLGSKLGTKRVKRDVSSSFAGAGVVLLLAGLGTGIRWRGRLP